MSAPLLSARDLSVAADDGAGGRTLLDRVSLDLAAGEILGLVGESGSGKSLFCRALVRLLPSPKLSISGGAVFLEGRDLVTADEPTMLKVRGGAIGMIFQNPTSHLDPVMRVGEQIAEGIRYHQGLGPREVRAAAVDILEQVGFPDPRRQYDGYPHEFSGGMRQRAMIGVALSSNPKILVADEPTTALDVTIQAQILRLLLDIRDRRGLSIILISHDLGVVAQTCDRIAVMREGRLVEQGEKRALLSAPRHPYTRALIRSHPSMPDEHAAAGAAPRAPTPEGGGSRPLLEINNLHVRFASGGGLFARRRTVSAINGVSLTIMPGETVGIVGESGSGKSTLARAILGLTSSSSGHITFDGVDLAQSRAAALRKLRSEAAMVFQDPYNALNPRLTIGEMLAEVLRVHGRSANSAARVGVLLDLVGLGRDFVDRKPRSMSGGQCQRAGIARALAVEPRLIIADECVAALDVTIQAQIIDLFRALTRKMSLTLLFIAHDLALVRNLCERVVVMYRGEIVEEGPCAAVFAQPRHAYTAALIRAIPDIDPDKPLRAEPSASRLSVPERASAQPSTAFNW
ncbi:MULTISPECIES: ABC transporter ATP-binding protein [unclassified Mesorhizobium]|uniref:dipeptide ABC transporter ATP-binding protein n=2 Tax=Mesorhizobium TaxID=68287 RepID=UPI000FE8AFC8|nr:MULTISPECIES: ABC transporter ATP-binding protein [unclassified Mesorhizobium]RWB31435.1 MAG: ABC transporter ATP-binding protein [Mesorhizobium sp.]TGU00642.1 ABC transporter ATP-binding protein [Mesorhizobium sp. M5C.F.Ca.ET.164.01.1.1]